MLSWLQAFQILKLDLTASFSYFDFWLDWASDADVSMFPIIMAMSLSGAISSQKNL